jgi:hypothetical protein
VVEPKGAVDTAGAATTEYAIRGTLIVGHPPHHSTTAENAPKPVIKTS